MWTARKKDKNKCEGCDHLKTFPVACVTCQNLILEQSPQTEQAEASRLSDLLAAVVGRIDEHSKEWENAKSAGEEKVMTRTEGKIREGRKISLMIKKIIKQSS